MNGQERLEAKLDSMKENLDIFIRDQKEMRLPVRMALVEQVCNETKKGLKAHIDNHWKWVSSVVGIMAIASLIFQAMKG